MLATYGRLGRTVLYLPVLVLILYGAFYLALALKVDLVIAERIVSTQDTRTGVWIMMLEQGFENFWIGVGVYETKSENSYLKAFASYGIGMVLLIGLLVLVSARLMWRIFRLRRWLSSERKAVVDLVIAYNGMYFAASMLEGIMISRVSAHLVLMLVFASIATDILGRDREGFAPGGEAAEGEASADDDGYDDEYAEHGDYGDYDDGS
jgi:hypothetical protein